MSIRKTQVTRKIEEIIASYLYRGRYPSFQTITYHFGHWLQEHNPGSPLFNPLKVFRKEKSSADKYNQNIEMIHQDISDAYNTSIKHSTQVMSDFSHIETERGKLHHEIVSLSKEIDSLLLLSGNADFRNYEGKVISFEDSSTVDKLNSDIYVNIKNQEVSLSENDTQSSRLLGLEKRASFEPQVPYYKHEALEPVKNAFDDNLNSAWWHVVKTKELPFESRMKAQFTMIFDQEEEVNHLEYIPHQGNPVQVKLEYTLDGVSFMPVHQKAETDTVTGTKVWGFQKIRAKGVRMVFEKTEYDERSGEFYNYYFGAKEINISKKSYVSKGTMVTTPIQFEGNVQEVSIMAQNDIPFNTSVQYEMANYDPNKNINELIWHPVSPMDDTRAKHAKTISLNVKEQKKIETIYSEPTGEVINGMRVFRLKKESGEGVISESDNAESFDAITNPKLFRGINQWKRERTYIPFKGEIPLNNQWENQYSNKPELIRSDYQSKSNELDLRREFGGFDDNFYRFSICIYSEEDRNDPLSISMSTGISSSIRARSGSYSVYVNRRRLSPVNDEVTLPFTKGWNEVQILYHFGNVQERIDAFRKDLPLQAFLGKFSFAKEKKVRGDIEHLQHVDVHSLFHNISPNNRNYFSIHHRQVVLNYLPQNCAFQLLYEEGGKTKQLNEIVLRAKLERDLNTPHITPKIYSIRLRAK